MGCAAAAALFSVSELAIGTHTGPLSRHNRHRKMINGLSRQLGGFMFFYAKKSALQRAAIIATLVLIGGISNQAVAKDRDQIDLEKRLLACDGIAEASEKLRCFNTVVASLKHDSTGQSASRQNAGAPVSVTSPAPEAAVVVAPPRVAAATTQTTPTKEPAGTAADDFGLGSANTNSSRQSSYESKQAKKQAKQEKKRAKREAKRKRAAERINATIVRSWKTVDKRFAVELDNGQVWRETQGTRIRQPDEGRAVVISRGRFGGYRMKVDNIVSAASVHRTK